jgi:hypothetical protein
VIVRSFCEGVAPTNRTFVAKRGAGRTPVCEGGWPQLAEAARDPGRDFEAIVCDRPERIGRRLDVFCQRQALCAEHGIPIICADAVAEYLAYRASTASHLIQQIQVAMAEYEDARPALGTRRRVGHAYDGHAWQQLRRAARGPPGRSRRPASISHEPDLRVGRPETITWDGKEFNTSVIAGPACTAGSRGARVVTARHLQPFNARRGACPRSTKPRLAGAEMWVFPVGGAC